MTTDSDGIRGLEERLRAGLVGVTPGPWYSHDHNNQHMADDPEYWMGYAWVGWNRTDPSGNFDACLARLERQRDGSKDFRSRAARDAAHIARCSPENISALLDALRTARAQLDEAREEISEIKSLSAQWMEDTGQADCYVGIRDYAHVKARAEAAEARLEELTREPAPFPQERIEGEELLASFVQSFRSGAQGAMMDCDAAEEVAIAIEAMLARLEEAKAVLVRLTDAAYGLSGGTDWNNGTHAKLHGYRQKLLDAIPPARAFLHQGGSDAR